MSFCENGFAVFFSFTDILMEQTKWKKINDANTNENIRQIFLSKITEKKIIEKQSMNFNMHKNFP